MLSDPAKILLKTIVILFKILLAHCGNRKFRFGHLLFSYDRKVPYQLACPSHNAMDFAMSSMIQRLERQCFDRSHAPYFDKRLKIDSLLV